MPQKGWMFVTVHLQQRIPERKTQCCANALSCSFYQKDSDVKGLMTDALSSQASAEQDKVLVPGMQEGDQDQDSIAHYFITGIRNKVQMSITNWG